MIPSVRTEGDFVYYVGNIACDISGITRKSTAENPIGAADFLIMLTSRISAEEIFPAMQGSVKKIFLRCPVFLLFCREEGGIFKEYR